MNRLRLALFALFLAALTAVWAYLFVNTRVVDSARQNQILGLVKQLKQLDSEWNVDVLKSQIELNKNYDPLVRPISQMAAIAEQLKAEAGGSAEAHKALDALNEAIARKTAIVDRFKTQNAIIRNSLRYIPTAHGEIQDLLRSERGTAAANPKAGALELAISDLVGEILKYNAVPDVDSAREVEMSIARMRDSAQGYPSIRESVENLLTHAGIVLRQRTRQVELLAQISQVPMAQRIDAVALAFGNRFDMELAGQAQFQQLLIYYSGFALLAIATAIGIVIYRSRTEFRRMALVVEEARAALRQSEAQLVHAERMAMMGEIVGGIVHEINTPLGYLRSGLQSARDNLESVLLPYTTTTGRLLALLRMPPGQDRSEVQEIYDQARAMQAELAELDLLQETTALLEDGIAGVHQINETVVNLLNFSRLDRTRITRCKVEGGIDSTLKLASHILKNKKVVKSYRNTSEIYCDLSQLNQVFLNIIKNAAQATPMEGGEIVIETLMADPDTLVVDITDNGAGIAPATLPKIFDAFFTTKKEGSGTGLGLSISKRIVDSHGGEIRVDSTPGTGTTFSIRLPVKPLASLAAGIGEPQEEFEIA
ncbi:MAG: hypothetical protein HYX47_15955 [Burkholderiales bacterium]|nr:hypothetical protein [Burkholderiales bacterium]